MMIIIVMAIKRTKEYLLNCTQGGRGLCLIQSVHDNIRKQITLTKSCLEKLLLSPSCHYHAVNRRRPLISPFAPFSLCRGCRQTVLWNVRHLLLPNPTAAGPGKEPRHETNCRQGILLVLAFFFFFLVGGWFVCLFCFRVGWLFV